MRILMISDTYFPRISGVATSIRSFRQGLELLGHEVDLLIPDYGSCTSEEYGIYRIPARNIPFFPRRTTDATARIIENKNRSQSSPLRYPAYPDTLRCPLSGESSGAEFEIASHQFLPYLF